MSNSDNKLLPFTYNTYRYTPISSIDFYSQYAFAGVRNSGMVIRSLNRYNWEKFYQTEDVSVSTIKSIDGYLYVGTEPQGLIYKINLSTMSVESFDSIGSSIISFCSYMDEVYVAADGSPNIYKLNLFTSQWDVFYTPYAPVNNMVVINNKLYLVLKASNIVSYDGSLWKKELIDIPSTNISSYRNISKEIYSYSNNSYINRTSIINSSNMDEEDILDIFPVDRTNGIKCIEQDGTSLVIGASNYARVYRILDNTTNMIFDTEGESTDSIVNIDIGTNLVAMTNKLYLVYSGLLEQSANAITTTTTTPIELSDISKNVIVTYPNGGEEIQLGSTINIQWSSSKGINDAIKIELIKGDVVNSIINSQTSNSGIYSWDVPLSLSQSNDYKIRITWLSAGTVQPENVDESDMPFNIVNISPITTTTTTTTLPDPQRPNTSSTRGIPVLVLPTWENITNLVKDNYTNSILIATSEGRILGCDMLTINGFMTGDRSIYADIYDGFGYSNSASTIYSYALHNKIVEIDENKVIQKWEFAKNATAIKNENIIAIFQGPIVNIKNDFGFWDELLWEENKPIGSTLTVYLRSAETSVDLLTSPWVYSTSSVDGETGTITRSLNNVGLKGQYLQVKIEMTTNTIDIASSITNVAVKYSSRNSSYFFTTKFTIDTQEPSQRGLLVASITQPQNTEIHFGIASEETNDWNNYQVITPNKYFNLNNNSVKVGIKMTSYDENIPEVAEFALMVGGEILKGLNI